MAGFTDISDTEQSSQEGEEGSRKGEELPVPLEDCKVIGEACDDRFHSSHLSTQT